MQIVGIELMVTQKRLQEPAGLNHDVSENLVADLCDKLIIVVGGLWRSAVKKTKITTDVTLENSVQIRLSRISYCGDWGGVLCCRFPASDHERG